MQPPILLTTPESLRPNHSPKIDSVHPVNKSFWITLPKFRYNASNPHPGLIASPHINTLPRRTERTRRRTRWSRWWLLLRNRGCWSMVASGRRSFLWVVSVSDGFKKIWFVASSVLQLVSGFSFGLDFGRFRIKNLCFQIRSASFRCDSKTVFFFRNRASTALPIRFHFGNTNRGLLQASVLPSNTVAEFSFG